MHLETERLLLEQLTAEHAPLAFRLYGDDRVIKYLSGQKPASVEEEAATLQRHTDRTWDKYNHGLMAVFTKSDEAFVGICGLLHWEIDGAEETEVAYAILPEYWGCGYATEAAVCLAGDAFARLGRTRVISLVMPENSASIKVALKNGMQLERQTMLGDKLVNVYAKFR
ncbi:MAG: GNAT family N-acetyltransferase [Candidatus Eremiobacteraeota bacterium]|nr:GNAT family N-acetyltransferase [Candidatus Eremiobacteraeota bacterium]